MPVCQTSGLARDSRVRCRSPSWHPERPRLHPVRLVVAWLISALALLLAAGIVPGAHIRGFGGAILVAAIVGVLNAVLPPIVAALRLPFTVFIGFFLVLALDAAILLVAADVLPDELADRRLRRRARGRDPRRGW